MSLYRIKPLEWSEGTYLYHSNGWDWTGVDAWTTETLLGTLEVSTVCKSKFYIAIRHVDDRMVFREMVDGVQPHSSLDEAKAAAESYYRSRLLEALEPATDKVGECIREIRGDTDDRTLIDRLCEVQGYLRHGKES